MSVTIGTQLGSVEILALLGRGGMGEVYRARDTKLKREVAIKILPDEFSRDPDRVSRFQREAEVLASLNHSNIGAIHSLEEANGSRFLVLELVEGETLAERIKRGPIPVDEALNIAKNICEALEAAHEKGVVHRDLKPGNVKITPEGKVKVLDFGLAKAFEVQASKANLSQSPTLSMAATQQGVILGTAAYMSPEQARGKLVDKRTDIWAFGAVLYELLTSKQAFSGEDATEILAAVVKSEPDWNRLPEATPISIRTLLRRCLRKDRRQRISDATDVRIEIEDAIAAPKDSDTAQAAPASTRKFLLLLVVAAATTIIAVVTSLALWRATRPVEPALRPLVRLNVDLGPDVSLGSVLGTDAILSPDGMRLVYVSYGRLFTRRLDQPNATELTGTEGAYEPFFSPDGQWVAFFKQGTLRKISVEGGAAVTLCATGAAGAADLGGSWGEDGNIIAALRFGTGLSQIPSAGGSPTPVTDLQSGEVTHSWPQVLPGGKAVLFTARTLLSSFDTANIEVMSLADHRRKTLVRGGTFGRYLPSGHLVYVNRGTLFAVPFDIDRLEVHGTPVPVLDQISYNAGQGFAQLDFSQTGTLIYRSGGAGGGLLTVRWLDSTGKTQLLLKNPGPYGRPKISPDGNRLALDNAADVWTYDWQRDIMTRLTFNGSSNGAIWSPDSRFILYSAAGAGLNWVRSDGGTAPQTLIASQNNLYPWSFSPDGKVLAYVEITRSDAGYDLYTVSIENGGTTLKAGTAEPFLKTPADERYPSFSPDGRWMMYVSDDSGTLQVYVRAFPDRGGKWQISSDGGTYPYWSSDHRTILFRTLDNHIMTLNYTAKGDTFTAEKPRPWTDQSIAEVGTARNYDLAPDGKRIVALMPVETAEGQKVQNQVTFLENFFDELRRKVPVGK